MTKERKERCAVDWSPEFSVEVREDLYETNRYDEDGERIIRSTFYLVATYLGPVKHEGGALVTTGPMKHKYGTRWASGHVHKEYASAKSERRHLPRDFDPVKAGWGETEPMYGSEAWTPDVEAEIAWREREEEGWNGGYRW